MRDRKNKTFGIILIVVLFALFAVVPIIAIVRLKNRWSCENNQCIKKLGGDYTSEEECKSGCNAPINDAIARSIDNIDGDVNDADITDTKDKSVVENKYCKRYGYYADDNYYGGYDGNVYLFNSNTFPKYFPQFMKKKEQK